MAKETSRQDLLNVLSEVQHYIRGCGEVFYQQTNIQLSVSAIKKLSDLYKVSQPKIAC